MPRKTFKIPGFPIDFPIEQLWENERDIWEGAIGEDPIGDDLDARLWAVRQAIRSGQAPKDACSTVIEREAFADLLAPLELRDPQQTLDSLWRIAGRHLRPRHMEILGSGLKATARLLDAVTRSIVQLDRNLERLPPVVVSFLTDNFSRLPTEVRANEKLDVPVLVHSLLDLGHTANLVSDTLTRKRRRPPIILRRQTLWDAAAAIEEATGSRIQTRWREKDRPCFKFRGENGTALLQFMKIVEPGVSEMALVKDFRSLRKQATNAAPSGK